MENIGYYIFILVAIIVAFLIIKNAVLGYIYWMYLR